jgi:tetrahydromethanopterin S-methyltransferase subunit G
MEKEENLNKSIKDYLKLISREVSNLEGEIASGIAHINYREIAALMFLQAANYVKNDLEGLVPLFEDGLQKSEIFNFIGKQNRIYKEYPEEVERIRYTELEELEGFGKKWFVEYERNKEVASNLEKYLPHFSSILEKFIDYSEKNKSEVIIESNIAQIMAEYPQVFTSHQARDLFILYLGFVVEYWKLVKSIATKPIFEPFEPRS